MRKKIFWKILKWLMILGGLILFLPKLILLLYAAPLSYPLADSPTRSVVIVFGAGLRPDGSAGPVLRDRLETAAQLYHQGAAKKLLMSGDNRFENYNEPQAMRAYALQLGVADEDIILDYAGRRTYDTCYRAAAIFGVESAILVTQAFHLPRALFLCNALGVESTGVAANNRTFLKRSLVYWNFRELFASLQAVLDVYFLKPLPVLGEREPIEF